MSLKDYKDDEKDEPSMQVAQPQIRKVLKRIAEMGATYPTELQAYCDLSAAQVGKLLRQLEDIGILERIDASWNPDKRLKARTGGSNGTMTGMKEVAQANWYGLNSERTWRIHDKDRDIWINEFWEEKKHISKSQGDTLMNEKDDGSVEKVDWIGCAIREAARKLD